MMRPALTVVTRAATLLLVAVGAAAPLRAQAPALPYPVGVARIPASPLPLVAPRTTPVADDMPARREGGPSLANHLRTGATVGALVGLLAGTYALKRESDRCESGCGVGGGMLAIFYPTAGLTVGGIAGLVGGGVVYLVRRR